MNIDIPHDYLKLEDQGARLFRDKFADEVVAREPQGGWERARLLRDADSFVIVIELESGKLKYRVTAGKYKEVGHPRIAIGPNLAVRMLTDFVPLMKMGVSAPRADTRLELSTQ